MKQILACICFAIVGCVSAEQTPSTDTIAQASEAVVSLEFKQNSYGGDFPNGPRAFCSGVVISADRIITNRHCAEAALPDRQVWVSFKNGNFVKATFVGKAELPIDAAVYSIDPRAVTVIATVREAPAVVGEKVFTVGMPLGLRWTVTSGIVSSVYRDICNLLDDETKVTISCGPWIQTDAAINPGNSGGALFDEHGRLMGISTLSMTGGRVWGIGMALDIHLFLDSIAQYL